MCPDYFGEPKLSLGLMRFHVLFTKFVIYFYVSSSSTRYTPEICSVQPFVHSNPRIAVLYSDCGVLSSASEQLQLKPKVVRINTYKRTESFRPCMIGFDTMRST